MVDIRLNVIIAINKFNTDTDEELKQIQNNLQQSSSDIIYHKKINVFLLFIIISFLHGRVSYGYKRS